MRWPANQQPSDEVKLREKKERKKKGLSDEMKRKAVWFSFSCQLFLFSIYHSSHFSLLPFLLQCVSCMAYFTVVCCRDASVFYIPIHYLSLLHYTLSVPISSSSSSSSLSFLFLFLFRPNADTYIHAHQCITASRGKDYAAAASMV